MKRIAGGALRGSLRVTLWIVLGICVVIVIAAVHGLRSVPPLRPGRPGTGDVRVIRT